VVLEEKEQRSVHRRRFGDAWPRECGTKIHLLHRSKTKRKCICCRQLSNLNNTTIQMLEFSSEAIPKQSPSNQIVRADFSVTPCGTPDSLKQVHGGVKALPVGWNPVTKQFTKVEKDKRREPFWPKPSM
jgi:hypothetical protein